MPVSLKVVDLVQGACSSSTGTVFLLFFFFPYLFSQRQWCPPVFPVYVLESLSSLQIETFIYLFLFLPSHEIVLRAKLCSPPQNSYVEGLNSSTSEYDYIRK